MSGRISLPLAIGGGILLAALVAVVALVVLRPTAGTAVGEVAVRCEGIGSTEACADWARHVLDAGPGLHTFDPEDVVELRLHRPFLVPGACDVEYFVGRERDEPAGREEVDCPST